MLQFLVAEVTTYLSDLCSHQYRLRPLLFALLLAWADPWVIDCQDTKSYTKMPLPDICLVRADHTHGLRDLMPSLKFNLPPHGVTQKIKPSKYK